MAKYRKILVAYDGSESAKNALAIASQMARENKSWIKVVAVLPGYQGDLELVGVKNIRETMEGTGRELLAEAQRIADAGDGRDSFTGSESAPSVDRRRRTRRASTAADGAGSALAAFATRLFEV